MNCTLAQEMFSLIGIMSLLLHCEQQQWPRTCLFFPPCLSPRGKKSFLSASVIRRVNRLCERLETCSCKPWKSMILSRVAQQEHNQKPFPALRYLQVGEGRKTQSDLSGCVWISFLQCVSVMMRLHTESASGVGLKVHFPVHFWHAFCFSGK